jgi:DNA-binding NarL/FixJ family response regulator
MTLRLLLVDDNPPFLEAARRVLEGDGLRVVGVASTTAEAVLRHRRLRPDVTLVDVNLGEENGVELARLLSRADGDEPNWVILISTYPEEDLADVIDAPPGAGFLSKSQLSGSAVRELIERSEAGGGGAV